jgi:thiamine biosynthesis protein ThiS
LQIRLNGELVDLAGPMTISALLAQYAIDPRRVAVEHNLVVVKRAAYDETLVKEGDEVEVVNFVGGGETSVGPPSAQRPAPEEP